MSTSSESRPGPTTRPAADRPSRPGSDRWFTPEQEAENCARLLGQRRHGLDSMLPQGTPAAEDAASR